MKFNNIDEILDFAIKKEEDAAKLYEDLSKRVDKKWISEMLIGFSKEELGHKNKLLKVKEGKTFQPSKEKIMDLKLAEYLEDRKIDSNLNYQEVLIIAMKEEKQAFRLYNDLAKIAETQEYKDIFLYLAQEEAKHKLRFEVEYDEYVLQEN